MRKLICILLFLFLSSVGVTVSAADVFNGQKLYKTHCAGCHGIDGEGLMPGMPDFSRGQGLFANDNAVATAIRNGVGTMPGFAGLFENENEVYDIVAFIRSFL